MQLSFDRLYELVERNFGGVVAKILLGVVVAAIVVLGLSLIVTQGVKPVVDVLSQPGDSAGGLAYQNWPGIALSAIVLGAVPVIGLFIGGHIFAGIVSRRLSAEGFQRASLLFRFEHRPPYELPNTRYFRIGIYNPGPTTAMDVKVRLLTIEPVDPLPEEVLPSPFYWKGGDWKQNITVDQERELDVMHWSVSQSAGRDHLAVHLCLQEGPASFEPPEGTVYNLHLQATALNAESERAKFSIQRRGLVVTFRPVSDGVLPSPESPG